MINGRCSVPSAGKTGVPLTISIFPLAVVLRTFREIGTTRINLPPVSITGRLINGCCNSVLHMTPPRLILTTGPLTCPWTGRSVILWGHSINGEKTYLSGVQFVYADYGNAKIRNNLLKGDYERNDIFFFALNLNWKF